jgi:CheY-like chemotaxis protein
MSRAAYRVLLVDDDSAFRASLKAFLEATGEFDVVAEASDGSTAVELAEALEPDVVLMDAFMPTMDGFASCAAIRSRFPDVPIVIVTGVAPEEDRNNAQLAGATRWVAKSDPNEITAVIRRVLL